MDPRVCAAACFSSQSLTLPFPARIGMIGHSRQDRAERAQIKCGRSRVLGGLLTPCPLEGKQLCVDLKIKKKLKLKFPLLLGSCTKPKMKACFRMVYPMGFGSGGPGKQEKGVGEYNLAAFAFGKGFPLYV